MEYKGQLRLAGRYIYRLSLDCAGGWKGVKDRPQRRIEVNREMSNQEWRVETADSDGNAALARAGVLRAEEVARLEVE